jgi:hypothetical protein
MLIFEILKYIGQGTVEMARGTKNHLLCKALGHKPGVLKEDAPLGSYVAQCRRCKEWLRYTISV